MDRTPGFAERHGSFGCRAPGLRIESRRPEAVPEFIRALGDDVTGASAEEALRKAGETGRRALLDAALNRVPSGAGESPSSLRRRSSALRLLSERDLSSEERRGLAVLIRDRDPEIAARACRIALIAAEEGVRRIAVRRLLEVLPDADMFLETEMEDWLLRHYDKAGTVIDEEIARRPPATEAAGPAGRVQRFLMSVKRRATAGSSGSDGSL